MRLAELIATSLTGLAGLKIRLMRLVRMQLSLMMLVGL
jgi:hypothetical protein